LGGSNDVIGSTCQISAHVKARSICTKAKTFSTGKTRGGIPFGRGALSHLLRNRFFIGEVKYRGEILPGSSRRLSIKPCSRRSSKSYRIISPTGL